MVEVSRLALVALFVWCIIATSWGIFVVQDLKRVKQRAVNAGDEAKDLEQRNIMLGRKIIQLQDELEKTKRKRGKDGRFQ